MDSSKLGFIKVSVAETMLKMSFDRVRQKISAEPDTVSDLVRLSFHDCFIRGCDGSILLDGDNTEQKAVVNQGLGGIVTVNDIKEAVEKVCPAVVFCTDILIIAARDAISLAGGKRYEVEIGRRDGVVSLASEAQAVIPSPTMLVQQAIDLFAQKGLTKGDFVVLLGGHTVGTAHCHSFKECLYNFNNTQNLDPIISASLLPVLQQTCPLDDQTDNEAFLDQTSDSHFNIDNSYYKQILANNGVMEIDQNLASSPLTRDLVRGLSNGLDLFLNSFGRAMVKMSRSGVLTGSQGEIRKSCGSVN